MWWHKLHRCVLLWLGVSLLCERATAAALVSSITYTNKTLHPTLHSSGHRSAVTSVGSSTSRVLNSQVNVAGSVSLPPSPDEDGTGSVPMSNHVGASIVENIGGTISTLSVSAWTRPISKVHWTTVNPIKNVTHARQCWDEVKSWANASASWYNSMIQQPNITWHVTTSWDTLTDGTRISKTSYPANASVYTLCDGSPRVDGGPMTTKYMSNSTYSVPIPVTVAPTFPPKLPCMPTVDDCVAWYYDSDIDYEVDNDIVKYCGYPAHETLSACIIAGGPARLFYFPVTTEGGNLCNNDGTTISPTVTPAAVTTLGQTFTTGNVYLWFETLYASYDGFWDRVGPTFSNTWVTLRSDEISTNCVGLTRSEQFESTGTALNYADWNYPHPASAYHCQNLCTQDSMINCPSAMSDCTGGWRTKYPACNTIWNDFNPKLAVPTRIRDMVPEWSTCVFNDEYIPNIIFDPPIALTPADVAHAETTAPVPSTIRYSAPLAPAARPTAENTASASSLSIVQPNPTSLPDGSEGNEAATGLSGLHSFQTLATAATDAATSSSTTADATVASSAQSAKLSESVIVDPQTDFDGEGNSQVLPSSLGDGGGGVPATVSGAQPSTTVYQAGTAMMTLSASMPSLANSPGNQPLPTTAGQTLSKFSDGIVAVSDDQTVTYTPVSPTEEATRQNHNPGGRATELAAENWTITITQLPGPSNVVAIEDVTVTSGAAMLVTDGRAFSYGSHGMIAVLSGYTITFSPEPTKAHTKTKAGGGVYQIAGHTVTASAVAGNPHAVAIDGTTLSDGGPAMVIDGSTISRQSHRLVVISGSTLVALPKLVGAAPTSSANGLASGQYLMHRGNFTVTAGSVTGRPEAVSIAGTTISPGGAAVVVRGHTVSVASGGGLVIYEDVTVLPSQNPAITSGMQPVPTREPFPTAATSSVTATSSSAASIREQTTSELLVWCLLVIAGLTLFR